VPTPTMKSPVDPAADTPVLKTMLPLALALCPLWKSSDPLGPITDSPELRCTFPDAPEPLAPVCMVMDPESPLTEDPVDNSASPLELEDAGPVLSCNPPL